MFLSCIWVPSIGPPNHLSGQCRPPIPVGLSDGEKTRRFMSKSRYLSCFHNSLCVPVSVNGCHCLLFPPTKATATGSWAVSRCNVVDHPALPQIADASYAGGTVEN